MSQQDGEHYILDAWDGAYCGWCLQHWPCDVVEKVMFAEATSSEVHDGSEVSTTREVCDHADWTSLAYSEDIYVDMGYRYCPKCGEKL